MSVKTNRKCPKCGLWNENQDYCTNCNQLLNPVKIRIKEDTKRKEEFSTKPPDQIDKFINQFKESKFFFIRWIYYVLYSIWFVFGVIVSFILYMVAGTVG